MRRYSFTKDELSSLYNEGASMSDIARKHSCSLSNIAYWFRVYDIPRRSRSDALYLKHNPTGDPFSKKSVRGAEQSFLFGLGLGLYWGEGNKRNKTALRLGNTDPAMIRVFIKFLKRIYQIDEKKLGFGLQIFSDTDPNAAIKFWSEELNISPKKFGKVIVTPSRGPGTYTHKSPNGVLTVYFCNKKLRNLVAKEIEILSSII